MTTKTERVAIPAFCAAFHELSRRDRRAKPIHALVAYLEVSNRTVCRWSWTTKPESLRIVRKVAAFYELDEAETLKLVELWISEERVYVYRRRKSMPLDYYAAKLRCSPETVKQVATGQTINPSLLNRFNALLMEQGKSPVSLAFPESKGSDSNTEILSHVNSVLQSLRRQEREVKALHRTLSRKTGGLA